MPNIHYCVSLSTLLTYLFHFDYVVFSSIFKCGPASGNSDATCNALGRARNATRYACSGSYAFGDYNECEIGDLSGKEGALMVGPDGSASGGPVQPDPLAALDNEFVGERTLNSANKWSSITFHNGSPRVLCGKLFAGELPPPPADVCQVEFILIDADTDTALRPLEATECLADYKFSIQARPTAACSSTSSALMVLTRSTTGSEVRKKESTMPFTIFGGQGMQFDGKAMVEGSFTISAQLFSERRQRGNLVVERSFDFSVVNCDRRLRGTA